MDDADRSLYYNEPDDVNEQESTFVPLISLEDLTCDLKQVLLLVQWLPARTLMERPFPLLLVPSFLFHSLAPVLQPFLQALRQWTKPNRASLARGAAADLIRSRSDLILENALLRQQLIVLERQVKRPRLTWRDRGILEALLIVQPETVTRWHRDIYRLVWRLKSKAKACIGRPPISAETVRWIRRLARENRLWGAERIRGELLKLGMGAARSTVQKYLQNLRSVTPGGQTWATFLRNHASDIWACDFLQTYDALFRTLFVFVMVELGSRRVVHFNVTRQPTDAWVAQQLREATPFGDRPGYLIHDNDGKFGSRFAAVADGSDIEILLTPVEAPRANAISERFIGSVRRECLDHFLLLSERHLYRVMKEYVAYFNDARPHQGRGQQIPCAGAPQDDTASGGTIISQPVLGGLHHDYRRAA
jgi:putative transposase